MKFLNKLTLALLILSASCVVPAQCTTTQITGTLVDAAGTPLNGQGCFKLPANAIDTSTNRAIGSPQICYSVTNGSFPAFANLTPNDVMQPSNLYYSFTAYDTTGAQIFSANYVVLTGSGTFNIGQATPTSITTSNISYLTPALLTAANVFSANNTFNGPVTVNSSFLVSTGASANFAMTTPASFLSGWSVVESVTPPTPSAGNDFCYGASTHQLECSFNGGSYQPVRGSAAGTCTMSAGSCTFNFGFSFIVSPVCIATWNGTGALTGIVKAVPNGLFSACTITSSVGGDTAVMQVVAMGNPN